MGKSQVPTPHNEARFCEISDTVLLPGDPLRAKFIAENYLTNVYQYNSVRNMYGYTGYYKGKKISVQGTGMGIPSIGIYTYELINYYGVKNLIRVGSAGAISSDLELYDIVYAMGASTNSNYASQYELPGTYAPIASYQLLQRAVDIGNRKCSSVIVGEVLSTDTFYDRRGLKQLQQWKDMGVLCVEMETSALYMNAAAFGVNALSILFISDNPFTGESTTSEEREKSFTEAIEIALELASTLK